jgi:thioesterase domain-containing protein
MDLSELDVVRRVAGATYQPLMLDASAILFRARLPNEELLPNIDLTNGWGGLFTRGVEVIAAKGDHWSIVSSEQNLAELAEQISMVLEMEMQDLNLQPGQSLHSKADRPQVAVALS